MAFQSNGISDEAQGTTVHLKSSLLSDSQEQHFADSMESILAPLFVSTTPTSSSSTQEDEGKLITF